LEVADQFLTIRDICEREQNRDLPLPQAVADDLFALFDRASDADLRVDLKKSETYSMAQSVYWSSLVGVKPNTATMRSAGRRKHQILEEAYDFQADSVSSWRSSPYSC
jgi:hypothetical protein